MNTIDAWPSESITPQTFAAALQAIHAPQTIINQLAPTGGAEGRLPDYFDLLEGFVKANATPEDRQKIAQAIGCAYADLTQWAIRADLQRIDGLDAEAAELLAGAGVMGVHDLGAMTEHDERLSKLQEELYQAVNDKGGLDLLQKHKLKLRFRQPALKAWGRAGRALHSILVADISVVLVVKGAGLQKPDETLSVFLNTFWPAVQSIDTRATLSQRHDVFPSGYRSSAYDKNPAHQVTEIRSGERRIWLKEPNWEVGLDPASPLSALFKEWRMATYAFGAGIHELFHHQNTRGRAESGLRHYVSFFTLHWLIFWHIAITIGQGYQNWGLEELLSPFISVGLALSLALAVTLVAALSAILPALETNRRLKAYQVEKGRLEALPGVGSWVAFLLMITFVFSPGGYVLWLLLLIVLQTALLRARAIAWPYREISNTDSQVYHFYSIKGENDESTGRPRIYRWNNKIRAILLRRLYILLYRYIVVLALPITFLGIVIAYLLQWSRVLSGLGNQLEKILNLVLSGVLGDVVSYAMDPAQAHRVRRVVEADLTFLHDRPGVTGLHVFAHSQGTPITFELLFNHLPQVYRGKIKTYITIGSVLSYYYQTNPILDPFYIPRFHLRQYPEFAPGFKWMNFWNLADPITEFYGLDEYNIVKTAPELKLDSNNEPIPRAVEESLRQTARYPGSPTNVKTRATLDNHSEYWSNLDQVHIPLALRLLGHWRPPQWNPDHLLKLKSGDTHAQYVLHQWVGWSILFLICFAADVWIRRNVVTFTLPLTQQLVASLRSTLEGMLAQYQVLQSALSGLIAFVQWLLVLFGQELIAVISLVGLPILVALPVVSIAYVVGVLRNARTRPRQLTETEKRSLVRRLYETDAAETLKQAALPFASAFSEIACVVESVEIRRPDDTTGRKAKREEETLIAHLTLSGAHTGDFMGLAPTGRQVLTSAKVGYRLNDRHEPEMAGRELDETQVKQALAL